MSAPTVVVTAPARLHFGFIRLSRHAGRRFGGVGLSVTDIANEFVFTRASRPNVELEIGDTAGEFEAARGVSGSGRYDLQSVAAKARAVCRHLGVAENIRIGIRRAIPRHQGLGSGTQLALTLGHGIGGLCAKTTDSRNIAKFFERGARSGIGVATFDHGGLIVDSGKSADDELPTVAARRAWPQAWRIVLVFDERAQGLHGRRERDVFARLPKQSEASVERLEHLVWRCILPAIEVRDFDEASLAIAEVQHAMSAYFKLAQSGHYTSAAVGATLRVARNMGVTGTGQSSWGPTGFALCRNEEHAQEVEKAMRAFADKQPEITTRIVSGENGASRVQIG